MNIQSPLRWLTVILTTVAAGGCIVYRYAPPASELTPAQHRWLDSVAAVREADLARILVEDRSQRRPRLTRNAVLDSVARARARDMAERGYFSHVNPDGLGPNALVRAAGYALSPEYDARPAGNDIEAAAAGSPSAAAAWRWFMDSPRHRPHLLGRDSRGVAQTEFGIGYTWRPQSKYGHYWVVLIARPGDAHAASIDRNPNSVKE
jgi:uncharacterized protein YkwD